MICRNLRNSWHGAGKSGRPSSAAPEYGAVTGVFLSIFMVMIIVVSLGVTYDTLMAKQAARELDGYVDALCAEVVETTPMIQRRAVTTFKRFIAGDTGINGRLPEHSKLTGAWLGLATMPFDGSFAIPPDTTKNYLRLEAGDGGDGPTAEKSGIEFGAIDSSLKCAGADLPPDWSDCKFFGTWRDVVGPMGQQLPLHATNTQFADERMSTGNLVICRVEAATKTFYFSEKKFYAKSVWALVPTSGRVKAAGPEYLESTELTAQLLEGTGLTIAVSPHLATPPLAIGDGSVNWGNLKQFRFPQSSAAYSDKLEDLRDDFDPERLIDGGALNPFPMGLTNREFVNRYDSNTYHQAALAAPVSSSTQLERIKRDLAVTCLNPAVLARNIFTSMLVELAARHGMLRKGTEILLAGTQNRRTPYNDWSESPSPPVKIVQFGEDLAQKAYVHPYVSFNAGWPIDTYPDTYEPTSVPTPDPAVGFDGGVLSPSASFNEGQVNPFGSGWSGTLTPAMERWRAYYTLLAGQLRSCYHLYRGMHDGVPNGASRYSSEIFEEILANDAFEPDIYADDRTSFGIVGTPGSWQSKCVCSDDDPDCAWGISCPSSDYLTAAAVVGTLGSIQICPAAASEPDSYLHMCKKPANPEDDVTSGDGSTENPRLRADFVALFRYLQGLTLGTPGTDVPMWFSTVPGSTTMWAYRSPGLWLKDYLSESTKLGIPDEFLTRVPGSENSHVVLVLHAPPQGGEIGILRSLVSTFFGSSPQRLLTIVYFPTTKRDADSTANVEQAFWAAPGDNQPSLLVSFNPYDTLQYGTRYSSKGDEASVFAAYWVDLLLNPEAHVARRAEWLMTTRILKAQLRY